MSDETRKRVAGAVREPQPGAYRAVLADPPWRSQQTGRFGAVQHYALMSDERILGLGAEVDSTVSLARWGYRVPGDARATGPATDSKERS